MLQRRQVVLWLVPLALVYGVLAGLRLPSLYVLSHMVIDYHFGFGKRGLLGALLHLVDRPPYHYITLASMAYGVLVLWLGVLIIASRRYIRSDPGIAAAFVYFFLSAGFACLVCNVGRGEHYGFLLAIPCLLLPTAPAWLLARALLTTLAVLVLEANFLIVAPFVAFDVWIGTQPRYKLRPALLAITTIMPATLLTWYLGNIRTACDAAAAMPYFQHLVADFTFQPIPLDTLCLDGYRNFQLMARAIWPFAESVVDIPLALLVALPSTLFNLWLCRRILKGGAKYSAAIVVVTFAPVMLLVIAADMTRFITLIQVTSLLALISSARRKGLPPDGVLPPRLRDPLVLTALAAIELGSSVTLGDGQPMLKFPFMPLVEQGIAIIDGHARFVLPSS